MEQLTLYIDNEPGSLSKILHILARNEINVRSVSTERGTVSEIRLIVDNIDTAQAELEAMGVVSHRVEIVVVELSDKPGQLALIASLCDKSGINIDYMYGIDNGKEEKGLFAIKTSADVADLKRLLQNFTLL